MIIAGKNPSGKSSQLTELAQERGEFAQRAAKDGVALREMERGTFDRLLKMGFVVIDQFLSQQGVGNLGKTVSADNDQILYRSGEPQARPLHTIFGQPQFVVYVHRERTNNADMTSCWRQGTCDRANMVVVD